MGVETIPREEVAAHSLSFSDYNGRLFCWRGGLYRSIPADQAPLYRKLFETGVVRSLIQSHLLIDTDLTDLTLKNSALVLQHRRLPFVSYPAEWCDEMFKAATLLHLDFCIALACRDLTTDDAHPINVVFEGTQPIFVDFGSITRLPHDVWYQWPWPPYEQFCQVFLYPLLLRSHGHGRIARWCAHDFENGVLKPEMDTLIRRPWSRLRLAEAGARFLSAYGQPMTHLPLLLRPFVRRGSVFVGKWLTRLSSIRFSQGGFLQQVRAEVADIRLPNVGLSYADQTQPDRSQTCEILRQLLAKLQPRSVLDVNSGDSAGDYAAIAARVLADCDRDCGQRVAHRVVAIDSQAVRVSAIYQRALTQTLTILPLILNFASPSHGLSNPFLKPAHERLQCELVMALTLDPVLVIKRGFDFMIDRLAAFSSRWLLIAFTPEPNASLTTRWQDRTVEMPWYTLENFEIALRDRFRTVTTISPNSDKTSPVLLLCER